jgi:hypothetical protein
VTFHPPDGKKRKDGMMRGWSKAVVLAMATAGALAGAPAPAQLLGGGGGALGGLGSGVGGALGGLGSQVGAATGGLVGQPGSQGMAGGVIGGGLDVVSGVTGALSPADLLGLRRQRLAALVRDNRRLLDKDDDGNPIRRDEILVTDPSDAVLATAQKAGFAIARRETVEGLGLSVTVLTPPAGQPARKAIETLKAADPQGRYALNHVYQPAFAALKPADAPAATGGEARGGAVAPLGLIDGGVGAHPAFAGAVKPTGHGTVVASLMVGRSGAFHGVAPGGRLYAADVYGGSPANGSAEAIVRAMGWLAANGARVVNISLVGAANPLLEAGVKALQAKGILIVAAVGNDGPSAPPQYPASYPGVIAVTGVDGRGRPLLEAGRASHVDFGAPGADMAGAVPGGGWEAVRGTSFAAPLVAASLAMEPQGGRAAVTALAATATPLRRTEHGLVCADCAVAPRSLGLK